MQKEILAELKALREAVAILAGTQEMKPEKQLSPAVLNKVAKEFKKLDRKNKEWIQEHDLYGIFRGTNYGVGKYLREELKFTQWLMKGKSYYYNRKAIMDLVKELKSRKVNLARYIELKNQQAKFEAWVKTAAAQKKMVAYQLPDDMYEVETWRAPRPSERLIIAELERLKTEFEEMKMGEYIDIYKSFAVHKIDYMFAKFRDETYRQRCKKWIENYNYAKRALAELKNENDFTI